MIILLIDSEDDVVVRSRAMLATALIGADDSVIEKFGELLAADDQKIVAAALQSVTIMGLAAKKLQPVLEKMRDEAKSSEEVRRLIGQAVQAVSGSAPYDRHPLRTSSIGPSVYWPVR